MIRNATEFISELRNVRARYTERYGRRISEIRSRYAGLPGDRIPGFQEDALEIHLRTYYMNALLQALNWRLDSTMEDGLPSLLPEVPD